MSQDWEILIIGAVLIVGSWLVIYFFEDQEMEAILLLIFGCVFLLVSNQLRQNEERNKIYDKSKVKYTDGDNT